MSCTMALQSDVWSSLRWNYCQYHSGASVGLDMQGPSRTEMRVSHDMTCVMLSVFSVYVVWFCPCLPSLTATGIDTTEEKKESK